MKVMDWYKYIFSVLVFLGRVLLAIIGVSFVCFCTICGVQVMGLI